MDGESLFCILCYLRGYCRLHHKRSRSLACCRYWPVSVGMGKDPVLHIKKRVRMGLWVWVRSVYLNLVSPTSWLPISIGALYLVDYVLAWLLRWQVRFHWASWWLGDNIHEAKSWSKPGHQVHLAVVWGPETCHYVAAFRSLVIVTVCVCGERVRQYGKGIGSDFCVLPGMCIDLSLEASIDVSKPVVPVVPWFPSTDPLLASDYPRYCL
jgi:hypothetical protein